MNTIEMRAHIQGNFIMMFCKTGSLFLMQFVQEIPISLHPALVNGIRGSIWVLSGNVFAEQVLEQVLEQFVNT